MASEFTTGEYKDDPVIEFLDDNHTKVDMEAVHQETFDVNMLCHAQDLKLYVKKGDDFELTDEGRRITLERQNMSAVEVRELIR